MIKEMQYYKDELQERREIAQGTEKDVARQHGKGRLTARERIELLFDPGTFNEIDSLVTPRYENYVGGKSSRYGDGVITGFGLINGRHAMAASQDASVMGGSLGEELLGNVMMKDSKNMPRKRLHGALGSTFCHG